MSLYRKGQLEAILENARKRGLVVSDTPARTPQGLAETGVGAILTHQTTPEPPPGGSGAKKKGKRTKTIHDETHPHDQVPDPKPKRHQKAALDSTAPGAGESVRRTRVRFTGYRVRPLDPDNFAGSVKDLLDGLRHAALIQGDEPWRIILETDQVKVSRFSQECTVVEIDAP